MGKPIKKKWFSAKWGSIAGNLQLTTNAGDETIEKQVGTGVYEVASGRVKLVDSDTPAAGEAKLSHDGKRVWKITQHRMYYFDGTESGVWRDHDGNTVGTFLPALTAELGDEPGVVGSQATADVVIAVDPGPITGFTVTDGGTGYTSVPAVTITGDGDGNAAATAVLTNGSVTSITVDAGGANYTVAGTTVTIAPPA